MSKSVHVSERGEQNMKFNLLLTKIQWAVGEFIRLRLGDYGKQKIQEKYEAELTAQNKELETQGKQLKVIHEHWFDSTIDHLAHAMWMALEEVTLAVRSANSVYITSFDDWQERRNYWHKARGALSALDAVMNECTGTLNLNPDTFNFLNKLIKEERGVIKGCVEKDMKVWKRVLKEGRAIRPPPDDTNSNENEEVESGAPA